MMEKHQEVNTQDIHWFINAIFTWFISGFTLNENKKAPMYIEA